MKQFPRAGAWAVLPDGRVCVINELPQITVAFRPIDPPSEEAPNATERVERRDYTLAEVHLADEHGEHAGALRDVPVESLVQATLEQIPEARRPDPDRAASLGYC